jgi:hypothetical protein
MRRERERRKTERDTTGRQAEKEYVIHIMCVYVCDIQPH